MLLLALFVEALIAFRRKPKNDQTIVLETRDLGQHRPGRSILQSPGRRLAGKSPIACKSPERMLARRKRLQSPEEGQPWVPDGSTVGPRFLGGNRGFPHKNRQPWVPATSFLFCVRWATRPNCQPLTLSHLESDRGPTASIPSAARPHCILPARNLETLTIF